MLITIGLLAAGLLMLLVFLLVNSPGKPKPVLDEYGKPLPHGISEKIHVNINGIQQGMFIKSRNTENPVLLFLHGGPGMPEYFLTQRYPTGLENLFTVCWWERRGAGLSYHPDIPKETMTLEQSIADTLEVTKYLRSRFGVEKIYLMGHSGGSFIGIQAAARAPELYHAYIGMAQISYQLKSETLTFEYILNHYKETGDAAMVRKLEKAPVVMAVPLPASYMAMRDGLMHKLGIGTTRDMKSVVTGVFLRSWMNSEYTLAEKVDIWRGKFSSQTLMWDKMISIDLKEKVKKLDIPVYFFHGAYDYTVSYPEAKIFFDGLEAPRKAFYTFEESAHSPLFEEPAKMRRILAEDVLGLSK
jgi:pimeloyl-ACP methyl ester carboxylesterase